MTDKYSITRLPNGLIRLYDYAPGWATLHDGETGEFRSGPVDKPAYVAAVRAFIDDGDEYIGRAVTLDGHPAKIIRDLAGWPWVSPSDPTLANIPFSPSAIARVCTRRDGRFSS